MNVEENHKKTENISLIKDNEMRSRGFACITFDGQEDAERKEQSKRKQCKREQ